MSHLVPTVPEAIKLKGDRLNVAISFLPRLPTLVDLHDHWAHACSWLAVLAVNNSKWTPPPLLSGAKYCIRSARHTVPTTYSRCVDHAKPVLCTYL